MIAKEGSGVSRKTIWSGIAILLCLMLVSGCAPEPARPTLEPTPAAQNPTAYPIDPTPSKTASQTIEAAETKQTATKPAHTVLLPLTSLGERITSTEEAARTPTAVITATPAGTPTEVVVENWKEWPVMPSVPAYLRDVYQRGLDMGNNPYRFSILGDCQSQPEVFMGPFDNDPYAVVRFPASWKETVFMFSGSFDRYSPTVKDGTTEGALLWAEWNDNKEKKCEPGETPLDCELRTYNPSIVFIHVGTHYEARNRRYLSIIIERLLAEGRVPILVTKADNTELDERINKNIVSLAAEYNLPLWNFWASVQHLPEGGMLPGSNKYLNEEAVIIHREGALEALDIVWRAVQ